MAVKMFSLGSAGQVFSRLYSVWKALTSQEVMIYYDIMITFGEEVERIWMRKFSLVTVLFFLVRVPLASLTTPQRSNLKIFSKNRYMWPLAFIVVTIGESIKIILSRVCRTLQK